MKQIIFLLMMFLLPNGIIAQVDDLYYVPTKKKVKTEIKIKSVSDNVIPTNNASQYGTNIVRIGKTTKNNLINGIDEDEYNRRNTYQTDTVYEDFIDEENSDSTEEIYVDDSDFDSDYVYSSRIVRFHSPRRAVILSSPLYWDVVYNSGLDNWIIYDDGVYWNVYSDYTIPWISSWNWYVGSGWGLSFGWGYNSWLWSWNCHHHHWHYNHHWNNIHHGHHGFHGWYRPFNGGYRNAIYTNRNGNGRGNFVPRATGPVRAASGIRAGSVARTNKNVSPQSERIIRKTQNGERVYNRSSSTRSNGKREIKENRRTYTNDTKVNRINRQQTKSETNVNNRTQYKHNAVKKSTRNNTEKQTQRKVRESNESKKNNNSSYNRSSVSRNNNHSNRSNSRSSFGSGSSRNSGFSGGSSRSGGSRGGGGRR